MSLNDVVFILSVKFRFISHAHLSRKYIYLYRLTKTGSSPGKIKKEIGLNDVF